MKEIITWYPKDDPFTKEGEILLHEKIHKQKKQKGSFVNNTNRIKQLIKAEKIIGKRINGTVLEIGAGNGYMSIYIAKNRLELDYPELYDPKKLIPVEGRAGTLIVFDSDVFHQGGKINKKGAERIVLRMHNYLS